MERIGRALPSTPPPGPIVAAGPCRKRIWSEHAASPGSRSGSHRGSRRDSPCCNNSRLSSPTVEQQLQVAAATGKVAAALLSPFHQLAVAEKPAKRLRVSTVSNSPRASPGVEAPAVEKLRAHEMDTGEASDNDSASHGAGFRSLAMEDPGHNFLSDSDMAPVTRSPTDLERLSPVSQALLLKPHLRKPGSRPLRPPRMPPDE
jgi:hypothetical protein